MAKRSVSRHEERMGPSFSQRLNAFETGERTWRADEDGLRLVHPGGSGVVWAWRDVVEMRLTYAATSLKPWRRKAWFRMADGETVAFDNGHFKDVGQFEDRSEGFKAVVREAIGRVDAARPDARWRLGTPPASYWAQVAFVAVAVAFLIWVVVLIPVSAWPGAAWDKLAVAAALVPGGCLWAYISRPRKTTASGMLEALG